MSKDMKKITSLKYRQQSWYYKQMMFVVQSEIKHTMYNLNTRQIYETHECDAESAILIVCLPYKLYPSLKYEKFD